MELAETPHLNPPIRARLDGVQEGRGIAALLVVAYHGTGIMALPKYVGCPPLWNLFAFGHSGVDFFFVLSGFIITHAHRADLGRPGRLGRYAIRRFTRIYPIYWLVTAALCFYMVLSGTKEASLTSGNLASSLLLLPDGHETLLGVAWTLRSEMLFYVVFCLAILDSRLAKPLVCAALIAIIVAGGTTPGPWWSATFASPYNLEFLLGIGAAVALNRWKIPKPVHILILGIFIFASFGMIEVYTLPSYPEILGRIMYGGASFLILLGIVAAEQRNMITIGQPLLLLGDASYCLYLIHFPLLGAALRVYARMGAFDWFPPGVLLLSLIAICVLVALWLRRWVEAPMLNVVNRLFARMVS